MKRSVSRFSFLVLFVAIATASCSENKQSAKVTKKPIAAIKQIITPLVSVQWLQQHLDDKNIVILDTSVLVHMDDKGYKTLSAQSEFDKEHIPHAKFADLKGHFSKQDSEKDFILPEITDFQKAVRELGVNNDSHVILYSSNNESWAARLWWMLKWGGFERASILNGGLKAWKEKGFPTTAESVLNKSGDFVFNLQPKLVAYREQVLESATDESVTLVDSLSPGHYKGDFSLYSRSGHITGAINLPSSDFVDESGFFRPIDELEMMLEADKNTRTITYCGGGVAASSVAFNLHRAGFKDVAVYMGSLQEWVEEPSNPMTLGDTP